MLTASLIGTALVIAAALGSAMTAYLWFVHRHKIQTTTGIHALAAMRWREFSHFVVEALRGRGFELDPEAAQSPNQADLMLVMDGKSWLLGCKQQVDQVIGASEAAELARSVRHSGAVGGILATLGKVNPAANSTSGIELFDGSTLWGLIEPLLPASLQEHLAERARRDTLRSIELSWVGALLVGFALAVAVMPNGEAVESPADTDVADAPSTVPASSVPPPAPAAAAPATTPAQATTPAPARATAKAPQQTAAPAPAPDRFVPVQTPTAPVVAPATEEERREEAMRAISSLEGVKSAVWSSRSTLLVYLESAEADQDLVARLCRTLESYEEFAASRMQLQPPADSDAMVRFRQCRVY
ncbi:MAG: restriction endonuclease [Pseudomonadota bacterium]|nr:restriction endonuclease [Pseudomonadota bacterium]